jgi:hypothetical protein
MFERVAALGSREFETGLNLPPGVASNAGESPNGVPFSLVTFLLGKQKKVTAPPGRDRP